MSKEAEIRDLSQAVHDLLEGGDIDYSSVKQALRIMKKHKFIDPDSEEWIYEDDK